MSDPTGLSSLRIGPTRGRHHQLNPEQRARIDIRALHDRRSASLCSPNQLGLLMLNGQEIVQNLSFGLLALLSV